MAARKKKRKTRKRPTRSRATGKRARKKVAGRKAARRAPRAVKAAGDLTVQIARQMAGVIERGLKRTLGKLPRRGTTEAAKQKLKDAIAMFRRQADAMRDQAVDLETRGAQAAAAIWRPLGEHLDRAASDLGRRLGR